MKDETATNLLNSGLDQTKNGGTDELSKILKYLMKDATATNLLNYDITN